MVVGSGFKHQRGERHAARSTGFLSVFCRHVIYIAIYRCIYIGFATTVARLPSPFCSLPLPSFAVAVAAVVALTVVASASLAGASLWRPVVCMTHMHTCAGGALVVFSFILWASFVPSRPCVRCCCSHRIVWSVWACVRRALRVAMAALERAGMREDAAAAPHLASPPPPHCHSDASLLAFFTYVRMCLFFSRVVGVG